MSVSASSQKKAAKKRPEEFGEQCLHFHCQQWLEKSGLWGRLLIFHVPNERKGGIGTVMHFKRMGVRPGVADYLMFKRNPAVAIELKDADGAQNTTQQLFQKQWESAGNTYRVVRTLEEFQSVILFG